MTRENFMNRIQLIARRCACYGSSRRRSLLATLVACTAGGPATTQTQQTSGDSRRQLHGSGGSANADVQAFRINLWENIRSSNKCGGCHHEGGQSPCSRVPMT